jgi:hypothetical protein
VLTRRVSVCWKSAFGAERSTPVPHRGGLLVPGQTKAIKPCNAVSNAARKHRSNQLSRGSVLQVFAPQEWFSIVPTSSVRCARAWIGLRQTFCLTLGQSPEENTETRAPACRKAQRPEAGRAARAFPLRRDCSPYILRCPKMKDCLQALLASAHC